MCPARHASAITLCRFGIFVGPAILPVRLPACLSVCLCVCLSRTHATPSATFCSLHICVLPLSNPYSSLRQKIRSLSETGYRLLERLLTYDPTKRIAACGVGPAASERMQTSEYVFHSINCCVVLLQVKGKQKSIKTHINSYQTEECMCMLCSTDACTHPYFAEHPRALDPDLMPTFPTTHKT